MQRAAPPGLSELDSATCATLRDLTELLVRSERHAWQAEHERYHGIRRRGLRLPVDRLQAQIQGSRVLVTGGTGCIGTALLTELAGFGPARLVSVSRGATVARRVVAGAEYLIADLRDRRSIARVVGAVRPDVIYHVAAQRDPGLAEREVRRTLATNVVGTRNVLGVAEQHGVTQLVYASTGKAIRPFTSDTYAASKKAGEWLLADAAQRAALTCSAARFTHVVDNSIVIQRLQRWAAADAPLRLHGPDIAFYVQSAREAAHLILNAGLHPRRGVLTIHAIRNLEWPVNLIDLALGALDATASRSPIYLCGHEPGYEGRPYPGLYDPRLAGEVSPLISAIEAPLTAPSATCPEVDVFPVHTESRSRPRHHVDELEKLCAENAPDHVLHRVKDRLSWELLDALLARVPIDCLGRTAHRAARTSGTADLTDLHRRIDAAIYEALRKRRNSRSRQAGSEPAQLLEGQ